MRKESHGARRSKHLKEPGNLPPDRVRRIADLLLTAHLDLGAEGYPSKPARKRDFSSSSGGSPDLKIDDAEQAYIDFGDDPKRAKEIASCLRKLRDALFKAGATKEGAAERGAAAIFAACGPMLAYARTAKNEKEQGRLKSDANMKAELNNAARQARKLAVELEAMSFGAKRLFHLGLEGANGQDHRNRAESSAESYLRFVADALAEAACKVQPKRGKPRNSQAHECGRLCVYMWHDLTGKPPLLTVKDGGLRSPLYAAVYRLTDGNVSKDIFIESVRYIRDLKR